ncbi:MAG: aldo/keto reductase [Firmicutes bacterium]|nr:aldo/keto reductase [Bacillota bacterium]
MIYREYGKTGKKISVIGFGGLRFPKKAGKYDREECAALVRKANELGVNYFDTAPYYCEGKSETIFGLAFQKMPGPFYVSTKSSELKGDNLRRDLERSLAKLGVDRIDFFHLWAISDLENYRRRMAKGGAYEAALQAKAEGLISHLAFSTHCNGDEIAAIVQDGGFEGVTLGYNVLNFPFRRKGLQAAAAQGMGVVVMSPLGGGVIPRNAAHLDFIRSGPETVAVAALRFSASHPEVTTVLSGMQTMEEVLANTQVGANLAAFPPEKIREIEGKLLGVYEYLCTGCGYCEPCPREIPIAGFLTAYNQQIFAGEKAAWEWLRLHPAGPVEKLRDCTACGRCEAQCTQHLPIIGRLREIRDWEITDGRNN